MTGPDYWQAQESQDQERQTSHRDVVWVCPYCGNEVGHEPTQPCCGEMGHEIAVDIDTGEPIED